MDWAKSRISATRMHMMRSGLGVGQFDDRLADVEFPESMTVRWHAMKEGRTGIAPTSPPVDHGRRVRDYGWSRTSVLWDRKPHLIERQEAMGWRPPYQLSYALSQRWWTLAAHDILFTHDRRPPEKTAHLIDQALDQGCDPRQDFVHHSGYSPADQYLAPTWSLNLLEAAVVHAQVEAFEQLLGLGLRLEDQRYLDSVFHGPLLPGVEPWQAPRMSWLDAFERDYDPHPTLDRMRAAHDLARAQTAAARLEQVIRAAPVAAKSRM